MEAGGGIRQAPGKVARLRPEGELAVVPGDVDHAHRAGVARGGQLAQHGDRGREADARRDEHEGPRPPAHGRTTSPNGSEIWSTSPTAKWSCRCADRRPSRLTLSRRCGPSVPERRSPRPCRRARRARRPRPAGAPAGAARPARPAARRPGGPPARSSPRRRSRALAPRPGPCAASRRRAGPWQRASHPARRLVRARGRRRRHPAQRAHPRRPARRRRRRRGPARAPAAPAR